LTPRSKSKLFLWIISFLCENPVNREKSVWNEKNRKKTFFLTFDDNVDNNKQQQQNGNKVLSRTFQVLFFFFGFELLISPGIKYSFHPMVTLGSFLFIFISCFCFGCTYVHTYVLSFQLPTCTHAIIVFNPKVLFRKNKSMYVDIRWVGEVIIPTF
jgi:hypothetical protein